MRARWVSEQSLRIGVVMIPLLVYVVDLPLSGNGFVSALVAGLDWRLVLFSLLALTVLRMLPVHLSRAAAGGVDPGGISGRAGTSLRLILAPHVTKPRPLLS